MRPSLLTKFGVLSLLFIAALGVVLGAVVRQTVRERTLADARRSAIVATDIGIKPLLRPEDLTRDFEPLAPERVEELDAALLGSLSEGGLVRLKVWNRQHWIVYSDNLEQRNRWFAGDELLDGSLAGEVTSEITDLRSREEFEERSFGEMLAVYVPLRVDAQGRFTDDPEAEVVGAFEVYLPYAPIRAAIDSDVRELWLHLGVGLGVLYLALVRLVATASRRLRRQAEENRHQARHDQLTDLPNRRVLREVLADGLDGGRDLAVALIDLDGFKEVNDTLGHHVGDQVLVQVGDRLAARARAVASDTEARSSLPSRRPPATPMLVARLGGDEFALLLEDVGDGAAAVARTREVLACLDAPVEVEGLGLDVRASAGIAVAAQHGREADTLLQRADVAMYLAKANRSGVEVYDAERDVYSPRRLALANEIRRAIGQDELVLHFQPKLDLRTMTVAGVEALVRWQHPSLGLISPGEFMPVVETTSLIKPLTAHVIDRALAQARDWADRGVEVTVAVNLSAGSVHDVALPGEVRDALDRHHLPASALVLELTETTLLADPTAARDVLDGLRALGVGLAVDDFGTGYASLSYLRDLPVDELKIDQSFVRHLLDGGQDAVIVGFSIDLARSLGLTVVAEGVEDLAVLDELARLGCDQAQGFHVSRPLPAAEAEDVILSFAELSMAATP